MFVQTLQMGRKRNRGTIEVHEGVYLKQSGDGSPWQCYFRLDGQQFRRSTKTADLTDAKLKALNWYRDAQNKVDAGKTVERVSFRKLAKTYLSLNDGEGKYAYHRDTLARHISPFFNRFADVSKINDGHIQDYIIHRRKKGPVTPQTINRENTVLRQLFKVAERRGWLLRSLNVDHLGESLTRRRRAHFTVPEYIRLCHAAQERIKELEGITLRKKAYRQRQLLFDYIKFIANTGIRVDESKSVRWRDVDFDSRTVLVEHAGKTKRTRTIYVRPTGLMALKRILKRRKEYLSEHGGKLDSSERVFSTPAGEPVQSFKKGFDALLEAAGFVYVDRKHKHSLTSLRHSYATFRLTTKRAKRASTRALALQLGTSERMIDKHYGHDQIHDYEEELAG